ncbi:hypothetical protein [Proteiniphilum sp.]|uniref:hypothetical protein n=1 Tax=Proteiniphilum sp. TaxID=1926877 RepID=UPI003320FBE2
MIGDSREDQELNFRLDTIRMRIMQIYREMEFNNVEINGIAGLFDEEKTTRILTILRRIDENAAA